MFKKKESNMMYFLGGTAVGVAAGLLAGKLLSSKSTTELQTFEPKTSLRRDRNKYSQDDNFHNLFLHANKYPGHMRSKSASRYENKACKEQPVPATSLTTLNNSFTNNINNLACETKYSTNVQKIHYNNNYQVYNISMEDNADYNMSNETVLNCKERKEYNNSDLSESKNMEMKSSCTVQSESDALTSVKDKTSSEATNKDLQKDMKTSNNIKLPKISNNLSKSAPPSNSTIFKNVQGIGSITIDSNISQDCIEDANDVVTCNSILDFTDEEESRVLHDTSFEDFHETDIISSTKQNDLEIA